MLFLKIKDTDLYTISSVVRLFAFKIILLTLVLISPNVNAQWNVKFQGSSNDMSILNKYYFDKSPNDSLQLFQALGQLQLLIQEDGYLTASFEEVVLDSTTASITFFLGEQYEWAYLSPGNLEEAILNYTGFKHRFYYHKPFRYQEVSRLMSKVLDYAEESGYPFAKIGLDSIRIMGNAIGAALHFEPGPMITFDSIQMHGESKTKSSFLSAYLRMSPGEHYNEQKVTQAIHRLNALNYLRVESPPYLSFQNEEATMHLTLADKPINRIDGIVGILPNEGVEDRILLTGQFQLALHNLFGTGKSITADWQRLNYLSQSMDVAYFHPNILRSPVNIQTSFGLLKEDTTFINREIHFELSTRYGAFNTFRLFTEYKTAGLLSTSQYANATVLPDFADFRLNLYGIGYQWAKLDEAILPSKGLQFDISAAIGNKRILINPGIPEALYDGLAESVLQFQGEAFLAHYHRIGKRLVLYQKTSTGILNSDQLFFNDLFRLGGFNTLRGFNENFFFADTYAMSNLELRSFLDGNSYVFAFYDQAYIRYKLDQAKFEGTPAGIGAGISLFTDAGIFNVIYAIGNSAGQQFDPNFSKIHFGYTSTF